MRTVISDDLDWNGDYDIYVEYEVEDFDGEPVLSPFGAESWMVRVKEAVVNGLDMVEALSRSELEQLEGLVENQIKFEVTA